MGTEQTPVADAEAHPPPVDHHEPATAKDTDDAPEAAAEAHPPPVDQHEPASAKDTDDAAEAAAEGDEPRWTAFAPEPETPPGRFATAAAAIGRVLAHEWTLASLGGLLLAVLMTWPTLRYPRYTIPQDIWDPTLQAWQMAWAGHALTTDPAQLWHGNAFFPERFSYAFSDSLLGYAPAGMIGTGPVTAVLRYNIMYVLLHALAFVGAYALVRQLGAGRTGAAVAGAAYAYAPWRLAQAGHMHVLSTGGIALALAMLARGHGWSLRRGYRPDRRHAGWALAGWLVAAWQISLGFGIGLPFGYVLGLVLVCSAVCWWVRRTWVWGVKRPFGARLALADLAGGMIFVTTGALLALPYFKVADLHPYAKRSVADLEFFSSPLKGFFVAPAESRIWGDAHAAARAGLPWHAEMTLLPGFVLYGLAAAGLVFSIWRLRHRLLLLAGVVLTVILGMGTQFFGGNPGYVTLFNHLPGWDGIRTPGRLVLWTTLLLGILAAGAVCAFVQRAKEVAAAQGWQRLGPWLRLATLVPLALVLLEGLNTTPHPVVPQQPAAMRQAEGPLLVLPSDQLPDMNVMLWSTDRFVPIVNGGSGFTPQRQAEVRQAAASFPDGASVNYLQELGVRTVIVLRDRIAGTPWEGALDKPADGLGIEREDVGDAVIFRLP
ncbi:MAG TPA: hypothetical protein VHI50_12855 [Micromonosporaceae bacterium]|nr:hypothetical protein [Micromonosporaceae bacterium]